MPISSGTEFEKPRGVSRVEVRRGYAQVHVTGLKEPLADTRLAVLRAIAEAAISLDFLKLTQSGVSFLIPEAATDAARSALEGAAVTAAIGTGASIVLVHAVNMRDEEGLVARLASIAIGSGAPIEHVADMHDRLLIVTEDSHADSMALAFEREFKGAN